MPISEIHRQLIEKHLDKSLSESEQAFFNECLEDADFVAELNLYKKSVHVIHAFGDNKLKMMLQMEEAATPQYNDTFVPKIPKKLKISYQLALAASVLLLIGVGYWFVVDRKFDTPKQNSEQLLATHFKPYKNFENPNVRAGEAKSDLEKAYSSYENGDYRAAAAYFEKIAPPQYLDESDLFFQANAYLATHQMDKASVILEKLSQNPASKWQQQAEWYLALALLPTEKEKAARLFEKIKNDVGHPCHDKAMGIHF